MRNEPGEELFTLMRALGVCPQCTRPIPLGNKAWGFGGCCQACRDGIGAALAMYVKRKPDA
jgi:hypothetical protein